MKAIICLAMFFIGFSTSYPLRADNLSIGVSKQGDRAIERPKSGLSMTKVRKRFGEPAQIIAAVGEPPITRWVYNRFSVYFEFDKVVHSVVHHKK